MRKDGMVLPVGPPRRSNDLDDLLWRELELSAQ